MKNVNLSSKIGNYTYTEINHDWKIKVSGMMNGKKYNTLVGCDGLLNLIGESLAERFVTRAMNCMGDVCHCKVYGGAKVSFYLH